MPSRWSGYRVHEMDPLAFSGGVRMRWRNGDAPRRASRRRRTPASPRRRRPRPRRRALASASPCAASGAASQAGRRAAVGRGGGAARVALWGGGAARGARERARSDSLGSQVTDPATGLKCTLEAGGKTVGSPTASNVTAYAWVYVW